MKQDIQTLRNFTLERLVFLMYLHGQSCYFFLEASAECCDHALELVTRGEAWVEGIVKGMENYTSNEIWTGRTPRAWGNPWDYMQPSTEIDGILVTCHQKMDTRLSTSHKLTSSGLYGPTKKHRVRVFQSTCESTFQTSTASGSPLKCRHACKIAILNSLYYATTHTGKLSIKQDHILIGTFITRMRCYQWEGNGWLPKCQQGLVLIIDLLL
ncbi:hypothetical protein CKAN_02252500 [Cinnamomum micranthum f. kanehirae]|uniref:Uncharacterized protein n=1 Tax=Cinnamomum micranthum f. kanehirae TaxID=337451 RepID=A0A3S3P4P0_9MAGN|nr:hypothetical protein CKAN_02252500 [Cinnamomum micranthum f. kanehirae]